jgi:hypothetical protein
MKLMKKLLIKTLLALLLLTNAAFAADPLPSWNDGPTKQGIISFAPRISTRSMPPSTRFSPAPT